MLTLQFICFCIIALGFFGIFFFQNHFLIILIFIEFTVVGIIMLLTISTIASHTFIFSTFIFSIILIILAGIESVLGITILISYYKRTRLIVDSLKIRG